MRNQAADAKVAHASIEYKRTPKGTRLELLISAVLGFVIASTFSEILVRLTDAYWGRAGSRTGYQILADAAALTMFRVVVVVVFTPLLSTGIYHRLSHRD